MAKFNLIGTIIVGLMLLLKILVVIFPPKKKKEHMINKQLNMIEFISISGIYTFSVITLFDYGYNIYNQICFIIFLVIDTILYLIILFISIRYIIIRKEEELYKKHLIIAPKAICEGLIYLVASILLFNPYVIFFSTVYLIVHTYIEHNKNYR